MTSKALGEGHRIDLKLTEAAKRLSVASTKLIVHIFRCTKCTEGYISHGADKLMKCKHKVD